MAPRVYGGEGTLETVQCFGRKTPLALTELAQIERTLKREGDSSLAVCMQMARLEELQTTFCFSRVLACRCFGLFFLKNAFWTVRTGQTSAQSTSELASSPRQVGSQYIGFYLGS